LRRFKSDLDELNLLLCARGRILVYIRVCIRNDPMPL
jgi:hypothetical protein